MLKDFVIEFYRFLKVRKKYWLIPIFIAMLALGALLIISKSSAVSPFIYTVF